MIPGMALLVAVLVGWLVWPRSTTPVPEINFDKVDPNVRRTLEAQVRVVEAAPASGEHWGWLGAMLRAYHFDAAAETCLVEAERLDPRNPRWPHFRSLLWISNNPQRALEEARQAADLAGNNPPLPRYRYAKLMAEEGRWEEARDHLQALQSSQPNYTPALLLLAHDALASDRVHQTIDLGQRCTSDPTTARAAWFLLAQAYQRQGDAEHAVHAAQQAAALPEDTPPRDLYIEELSRRRGDPREMSILCHSLLASRNLGQASAIIDQLVRDHPNDAETWLLHGRLQLLRQNPAGAEQSLRRHLVLEPDSTQGLFQLGTSLLRQDKITEAANAFTRATQIKPDFGPAWFNRGLALGRAGQLRESMASFQETLRHNPEHLDAYFFLADLHLRLGEPDLARQRLAEAATLNPADPRLEAFRKRVGP